MKTDKEKNVANKKSTSENKHSSAKNDLASRNSAYEKPMNEEPAEKQKHEENKEIKKTPSSKAIELDEDIRNDIFKTEVNSHAQKRSPLHNEKHAINPEEVNEDQRIVNDEDDDQGTNKYNSL